MDIEPKKTKLTMVSIWFRGTQRTVFINLPLCECGSPVVQDINDLSKRLGFNMPLGSTYTLG